METIKHKATVLKGLLYLKDIIDSGQIQKTADKNGIKQSNLSLLIRDLEAEFNTSLLYKTTTGVLPTNSAQQIYEDINEIEQILNHIQSKFDKREAATGTISLWAGNGLVGTKFMSIISDFYAQYPTIRLNILTTPQTNLSDVDLVFIHNRSSNIPDGVRLISMTRQLKFYSTRKYLHSHGQPKDLNDLMENYDLCLLRNLLKWPEFKEINKRAKHLNTTTDIMSSVLSLITCGGGITFLPEWCAKYNPTLIELKKINFSIPLEIYLICKKGFENQKRILALTQILKEAYGA